MTDIYLRPLQIDDAKTSYKWRNDPRIWEHTGSRPTCEITLEMEEEWMRKVLNDSDSKRFAICLRDDDRYIGNVYLINIEWGKKSGEEGLFIGDVGLWGCGIGTRARLELHRIAAEEYGIREILSRIRIDNVGSYKSALRAGFVERKRDSEWITLGKMICDK